MKSTIKNLTKIVTPILILLLSTGSTLAHAPEEHITANLCEGLNQQNWADGGPRGVESEACNPGPNGILPSLIGGITHERFPNGLCFPSFNNYTDNGMDVFNASPVWFPDERNFLKAKIDDGAAEIFAEDLEDTLTVEPGDRVMFYMYIHNDGDSCLNDNIFDQRILTEDDFGESWRTTAKNTRIDFKPPQGMNFQMENNTVSITLNGNTAFNAGIQADNAVAENNRINGKTKDNVNIQLPNGVDELKLVLDRSSVTYFDFDGDWNNDPHRIVEPIPMFTNQLATSTLLNGRIKDGVANSGDYFASEPYIGVVAFALDAEPEAVCTGITYDAPFSETGAVTVEGRSYRPIKIDEINFSDGVVPENAKLKFTSADPDGDFRTFNGSQGPGPLELPANAVSVLYAGEGPVTVEVINVEESEEGICKIEIEKNACEDISFNFALHRQIGPIQQGNDGTFAQLLQIDSVEFENGVIPANTRLHWTSDNPDGEFYFTLLGLGPIGDPLPDIDNDPDTITVETPANNNAVRTLFYFGGEDSIEIKISPEDIQAKCVEEVNFDNPQICRELIVNNNNPIIEGYVSEFSAVALDENGEPYTEGGDIRYSVDEGFGTFYDEQPDTPPMSPAPFMNNDEARRDARDFGENRPAWMNEVMNNIGGFDFAEGFQGGFEGNVETDFTDFQAQPWWVNDNARLSDEAKERLFPTVELTEEQLEEMRPDVPRVNPPASSDEESDTFNWLNNFDPKTNLELDPDAFDMKPTFGGIDISEQLEKNKVKVPNLKLPPADLDPSDFGGTNSFDFGQNKGKEPKADNKVPSLTDTPPPAKAKPGRAAGVAIDAAALQANDDMQINAEALEEIRPQGPILLGAPGANAQSVEAAAGESVYLDAEKGSEGEDVVYVEQLDEEGNPIEECSAEFPIEDLICRSINVVVKDMNNRELAANEPLVPNMMYAVHARSTFFTENGFGPVHKQGSGIAYEVDENYGVFVAINPTIIDVWQAMRGGRKFADEADLRAFVASLGDNADEFIIGSEYDGNNPDVAALITFDNQTAGRHLFFLTINTTGQDAGDENVMCSTSRNLDIPEIPDTPICTALDTTIRLMGGNEDIETLEEGRTYFMASRSNFEGGQPEESSIRYASANRNHAVFIDVNALPVDFLFRLRLFGDIITAQSDPNVPFTRNVLERILRGYNLDPAVVMLSTIEVPSGENVYFVTFDGGASRPDLITATQIVGENDEVSGLDNCINNIPIEVPVLEPICVELTATINELIGGAVVDTMSPDQIYVLTASSEFQNGNPAGERISYAISDPDQAVIININALPEGLIRSALFAEISRRQNDPNVPFTRAELTAIIANAGQDPAQVMTNVIEVAPGEQAYVVTFNANGASREDLVTIVQRADAPFGGAENCAIDVPLHVTEHLICVDLTAQIQEITNVGADWVAPLQRAAVNSIARNGVYEVTAAAQFEGGVPENNQVRYTIDPRYGVIFNPEHESLQNEEMRTMLIRLLRLSQQFRQLTPETLINMLFPDGGDPSTIISNDILVDAGTNVLIVTYSNAPTGANTLRLAQVGEGVEGLENCVVEIPIPADDICVDLDVNVRGGGAFNPENEATTFDITGNFRGHNGDIVVEITEGRGSLSRIGENENAAQRSFRFSENEVQNNNTLSFVYNKPDNFDPEQRVTIRVQAVNDANLPAGVCQDSISSQEQPGDDAPICVDLTITRPEGTWNVEVGENDDQDFRITVVTDPANKSDEFYYNWDVTDGSGEWERDNNDDGRITERGRLDQTLQDYDDETAVRVWASRDAAGNDIFPACVDTIDARGPDRPDRPDEPDRPDRPTPPEITKVVYPKNNIDKAGDTLNISDKTKTEYVTFMAIFTPNDARSVTISEESLENMRLDSTGSLTGRLQLTGMEIIAIEDLRDEEGAVIYRTPGYEEDEARNSYSDAHYGDVRADFDCEERDNKFCIEDLGEDTFKDFGNGRPIAFNNMKFSANGRIVIKYQMKNLSVIDEESCKTLSAESGCGEKFRNVITYTAYDKVDYKGNDDRGSDRAETTVMCPYALSRQGGDVLFHDIIDSGVDVSRCAPVKSTTGVGVKITPIPEVPPEINRTGGSEGEAEVLLTKPSHDICKFSNSESNDVEGYSNALKNFSSSVCELQAQLAEELYEVNIADSIAANINRIARWSSNLNDTNTINSIMDLMVDNYQSGVFVKTNGDLTINGLEINGENGVPAAQTYIVRGHDLIINGDITYGTADYTNPNGIASVAFIVIDGDIIIDKNVKQLDGIYMAVNMDAQNTGADANGQFKAKDGEKSDITLEVNGGLYGNVNNLFSNRIGIGDPRYDQGSVTIKYDERILLNTPPGIGELINIQQAIVPN